MNYRDNYQVIGNEKYTVEFLLSGIKKTLEKELFTDPLVKAWLMNLELELYNIASLNDPAETFLINKLVDLIKYLSTARKGLLENYIKLAETQLPTTFIIKKEEQK